MSTEPGASTTRTSEVQTPRRIDEYLRDVLAKNGSDLHFVAGDPPRIRLYGELQPLREENLGQDQVREYLTEIMTRRALQRLEEMDGVDFAYTIPGYRAFASTCSGTSAVSARFSARFHPRRSRSSSSTCPSPCEASAGPTTASSW